MPLTEAALVTTAVSVKGKGGGRMNTTTGLARRIDSMRRNGMTYIIIARRIRLCAQVVERIHRDWLASQR